LCGKTDLLSHQPVGITRPVPELVFFGAAAGVELLLGVPESCSIGRTGTSSGTGAGSGSFFEPPEEPPLPKHMVGLHRTIQSSPPASGRWPGEVDAQRATPTTTGIDEIAVGSRGLVDDWCCRWVLGRRWSGSRWLRCLGFAANTH